MRNKRERFWFKVFLWISVRCKHVHVQQESENRIIGLANSHNNKYLLKVKY